jgi:hypothetical protein
MCPTFRTTGDLCMTSDRADRVTIFLPPPAVEVAESPAVRFDRSAAAMLRLRTPFTTGPADGRGRTPDEPGTGANG